MVSLGMCDILQVAYNEKWFDGNIQDNKKFGLVCCKYQHKETGQQQKKIAAKKMI